MKRNFVLWQWVGFAAVAAGGTLLHFLYEWSGESRWVAPFSGVNESTWEHMKLLYFPWFVFAWIQRKAFPELKGFWCGKGLGIASGLVSIPVIFYTYNGVFGKSPDWLNITIFFVAAALTFYLETVLLQDASPPCKFPKLALFFLFLIGVAFVLFTFCPPRIPLFQDPLNFSYGI